MPSQDEAIKHYRSLKPGQFSYLEQFVIKQGEPAEGALSRFSLEIELIGITEMLYLSFWGVSELRVDFSKGYGQFLVNIHSIRDYQWEGLKYHVTEEDNQVSFYCHSFNARQKDG